MEVAISFVVLAGLLGALAFALRRSRARKASAVRRTQSAEAELFETAKELSTGVVAVHEDPEREAAKARVAAAWDSPGAVPAAKAYTPMVHAPAQNDFLGAALPAMPAAAPQIPVMVPDSNPVTTRPMGLSLPVAPPVLPQSPPPALRPQANAVVGNPVAADIANRLHSLADRVSEIASDSESEQSKADRITLLLAREWAALPVNQLGDGSSIR